MRGRGGGCAFQQQGCGLGRRAPADSARCGASPLLRHPSSPAHSPAAGLPPPLAQGATCTPPWRWPPPGPASACLAGTAGGAGWRWTWPKRSTTCVSGCAWLRMAGRGVAVCCSAARRCPRMCSPALLNLPSRSAPRSPVPCGQPTALRPPVLHPSILYCLFSYLFADSKGVVHMDVKSSNVLLTASGCEAGSCVALRVLPAVRPLLAAPPPVDGGTLPWLCGVRRA